MKNWKTVVLTVLVILLVAVFANVAWYRWETRAIRSRIAQYKLIKQENQLATDILTLRYEAALIRAKFSPPQSPPIQPIVAPPQVTE